jgi:hypothetical protein
MPSGTVILAIAASPLRNTCAPPSPLPGMLVTTGRNGGVLASSIASSPPRARAQIARSRLAVITSSTSSSRIITSRLVCPATKRRSPRSPKIE